MIITFWRAFRLHALRGECEEVDQQTQSFSSISINLNILQESVLIQITCQVKIKCITETVMVIETATVMKTVPILILR
jgi:hypothetical protein